MILPIMKCIYIYRIVDILLGRKKNHTSRKMQGVGGNTSKCAQPDCDATLTKYCMSHKLQLEAREKKRGLRALCPECNKFVYRNFNFQECTRCKQEEAKGLPPLAPALHVENDYDARLTADDESLNVQLPYMVPTKSWHHADCRENAMTVVTFTCDICKDKEATLRSLPSNQKVCDTCQGEGHAIDDDEHYLEDITLCRKCSWVNSVERVAQKGDSAQSGSGSGVAGGGGDNRLGSTGLAAMIRMVRLLDTNGARGVSNAR